jgi:hypothetical protein
MQRCSLLRIVSLSMRNWTGSRIQEDALAVCCRDCLAQIGELCKGLDGKPLQAFPAHAKRLVDSQKVAADERS